MIKTFMCQSGKVNELRQTFDLCGKWYSAEFYDSLNKTDDENVRIESYKGNRIGPLFRQEYIEVTESECGELLWKAIDEKPDREYEFDLESSLGLFSSINRGEFGGMLITPKGTLRGNFTNLFEFNNKVYAVDSLNHLGFGHTCIYEFDNKADYKMVYETKSDESMSVSAFKVEENRILILVSGTVRADKAKSDDSSLCSYLLEISDEGLKKIAVFDFDFFYVYNMLLIGKELVVGMDKVVAFANTETKEIRFFTPLTPEAENNIRKVNNE